MVSGSSGSDWPATVPAVLDLAVARNASRTLLTCDGRDVSPGELDQASRAVAGALDAWGIAQGDRVAVMMPNIPEFVSVWFGIVRAGAIEVPVHSAYRGPLLEHILAESGARVLFVEAEFASRLEGLSLPELERVVVRGSADLASLRVASHSLEEAFAATPPAVEPAMGPDDVTSILYTSGTTGPAKGVVLTHSANMALTIANVELMEYTDADVLYTVFPLFHINAKFTSVVSAMMTGARLVLDERFSASRFWDTMREHGVTAFNYMGSMATILAKQPPSPADRDHRVSRAYGAACPLALWPEFEKRFGLRLHEHYGMTEIGLATHNTREVWRLGSCGRPNRFYEARVADEDDNEAPVGEVGELQVRPRLPGVMMREYWKRPDATIEAFRNLWFHTGDRARMDADGFFYYVDRLKDSIRRRGENVSSFDVESVVNAFPAVVESAAYGVPSEVTEDDVMVAVVADPDAEFNIEELIAYCEQHLAHFAVPRYIRMCDALPKTPSQRVQKFVLREQGVTADTFDRGSRAGSAPR